MAAGGAGAPAAVRVAVRLRPLAATEKGLDPCVELDENADDSGRLLCKQLAFRAAGAAGIVAASEATVFSFDGVFGPRSTQASARGRFLAEQDYW